jgi:hypothetical protein
MGLLSVWNTDLPGAQTVAIPPCEQRPEHFPAQGDHVVAAQHADDAAAGHHGQLVYAVMVHLLQRRPESGLRG